MDHFCFRVPGKNLGQEGFSDRLLGVTPESTAERELLTDVAYLVKVVMVNWLHSRSPLLIPVYRGPRLRRFRVSSETDGIS
jgi:hypothetical protein